MNLKIKPMSGIGNMSRGVVLAMGLVGCASLDYDIVDQPTDTGEPIEEVDSDLDSGEADTDLAKPEPEELDREDMQSLLNACLGVMTEDTGADDADRHQWPTGMSSAEAFNKIRVAQIDELEQNLEFTQNWEDFWTGKVGMDVIVTCNDVDVEKAGNEEGTRPGLDCQADFHPVADEIVSTRAVSCRMRSLSNDEGDSYFGQVAELWVGDFEGPIEGTKHYLADDEWTPYGIGQPDPAIGFNDSWWFKPGTEGREDFNLNNLFNGLHRTDGARKTLMGFAGDPRDTDGYSSKHYSFRPSS
jgi:hypothetical protein